MKQIHYDYQFMIKIYFTDKHNYIKDIRNIFIMYNNKYFSQINIKNALIIIMFVFY